MLVNINPITVNGTTTDKALINLAMGANSINVSLFPVAEIDGEWTQLGTDIIPVIGLDTDSDVAVAMATIGAAIQELVSAKGI